MKQNILYNFFIIFIVFLPNILFAKVVDHIANRKNISVQVNAHQEAFDTDKKTKSVVQYPYTKEVIKINLREATNTQLVLPDEEIIDTFLLGDTKNFKFIPFFNNYKNMGEIRPIRAGMDTNLTITGKSGMIYSFYLRTYSTSSKILPHFVVYIQNNHLPKTRQAVLSSNQQSHDYLRTREVTTLTKVNRNYKVLQENSSLKPLDIFDDGHGWTYFKFGDGNLDLVSKLPVLYKVKGGYDTLVNTEFKDGFLIAKTTSDKWTLRLDDDYACIRRN